MLLWWPTYHDLLRPFIFHSRFPHAAKSPSQIVLASSSWHLDAVLNRGKLRSHSLLMYLRRLCYPHIRFSPLVRSQHGLILTQLLSASDFILSFLSLFLVSFINFDSCSSVIRHFNLCRTYNAFFTHIVTQQPAMLCMTHVIYFHE